MRIKNAEFITAEDVGFDSFITRYINYSLSESESYKLIPRKHLHLFIANYQEYFLVYNPFAKNRQVILLNDKTKDILDLCDGQRNIKEIFQALSVHHYKPRGDDVLELTGGKYTLRDVYRTFIAQKSPLSIGDLTRAIAFLNKTEIISGLFPNEPILNEFLSSPLSIWLHLTNQCNFRCKYCYVAKSKGIMNLETGKKVVDFFLRSARKQRHPRIQFRFSGGEPSLEPPLLLRLADYARKRGEEEGIIVDLILLTNGSLLNSNIINELQKRGFEMLISLDGLKNFNDRQRIYADGRGTFNDIEKAINLLLSSDYPFSVLITITPENIGGLPDLVAYLLDKKVRFIFNFIRDNPLLKNEEKTPLIERTNENALIQGLIKTYQIIKDSPPPYSVVNNVLSKVQLLGVRHSPYGCEAGQRFWAVNQQGEVFPCHMMFSDHRWSLGKIKQEENLIELKKGKRIEINPPVDKKDKRRECLWRYGCGGGCSMATYNAYGRFDLPSPFCSMIKVLMPEVLKLEAERLVKYWKQ